MWWIPAGTRPTIEEAFAHWEKLRDAGPSAEAFGWDGAAQAEIWKTARCGFDHLASAEAGTWTESQDW